MTMGFRMVRKPSIWTPLKLSFSLVFFPSVTARLADAAGFKGLTPVRLPPKKVNRGVMQTKARSRMVSLKASLPHSLRWRTPESHCGSLLATASGLQSSSEGFILCGSV